MGETTLKILKKTGRLQPLFCFDCVDCLDGFVCLELECFIFIPVNVCIVLIVLIF